MAYWDTSALLKLYVAEHDSPFFVRLHASEDEPVFSSAIVMTEVICALYRKEQAGDLRSGGAKAVFRKFSADVNAGNIVTVPYGADVVKEAENLVRLVFEQPRPILVRSLDLIHVSSAVAVKARVIVATDTRLRKVAALAGLKALP